MFGAFFLFRSVLKKISQGITAWIFMFPEYERSTLNNPGSKIIKKQSQIDPRDFMNIVTLLCQNFRARRLIFAPQSCFKITWGKLIEFLIDKKRFLTIIVCQYFLNKKLYETILWTFWFFRAFALIRAWAVLFVLYLCYNIVFSERVFVDRVYCGSIVRFII